MYNVTIKRDKYPSCYMNRVKKYNYRIQPMAVTICKIQNPFTRTTDYERDIFLDMISLVN